MMQTSNPVTSRSGSVLGIPAAALAALPACPACYPAYAGILSALGLGGVVELGPAGQAIVTAVFVAATLAALGFRARSRRGYAPLALGLGAAVIVGIGKFVLLLDPMTYAGVGVLVAAGVWNVWPRSERAACPACASADVA